MRQPGEIPAIPPSMPRVRPNRFTRWLGRAVLRAGGWRIEGELPDAAKLVLIVAPHSSNWDGLWGFAAKMAIGFEVKVLAKAQLFWWPLGPVLRRLGAVPVNRNAAQGVVGEAVETIGKAARIWFAITPEGTRKRVEHWKTGFWKIAHGARVPVWMAAFHYPEKMIVAGPLFHTTEDMAADMESIRTWYRPWMGKTRGTT